MSEPTTLDPSPGTGSLPQTGAVPETRSAPEAAPTTEAVLSSRRRNNGASAGGGPDPELLGRLRSGIRDVPDYPSAGILFKDVTPLLGDADLFADSVAALAAGFGPKGTPIDVVAGVEARGFIFGAPLALALGVGFVPIRKSGKLPYTTVSAEYALEYGVAAIEVHTDAVRPGQRVLLFDDVLATGGTAEAAARLLEQLGAEVVSISFLLELAGLGGRDRLPGRQIRSLLAY